MSLIHVLVVDDSVMVRKLLTSALGEDPVLVVAGTAATGRIALAKIPQVAPDLVVLDLEMPELDGLATLREIRRLYPLLPVVMFGSITEGSVGVSLEALAMGPTDFVAKPASAASVHRGVEQVLGELVGKIKALCATSHLARRQPERRLPKPPGASRPGPAVAMSSAGRADIVALGASTGGPDALAQVLSLLPPDFPVPVVVVQHMPAVFTARFAQRLDGMCPLRVREARTGDVVSPGVVLLAPGDHHMRVRRDEDDRVRVVLDQSAPESFCRPAVDPLLRSVAEVYGGRALAVVLTGMGQDGTRGCRQLRAAGATILAQDETTSVVWGMPGAVAGAGLAHRVLPLQDIAAEVLRLVPGAGRAATPVSVP